MSDGETRRVSIDVNGRISVSGVLHLAQKPAETAVVLAHGAGANMDSDFMVAFAEGLAQRGFAVLRFNFSYMDKGRKLPDPSALLEATVSAAARFVRDDLAPQKVVVGGKSMGGRMASRLLAKSSVAEGALLLGYPLHPPKKKDQLRSEHLFSIQVPMLFVQGTRDPLCDLALLRPIVEKLGTKATLHVVEGGDHSLDVLKSQKRTQAEVRCEVMDVIASWLKGL